MIVLHFSCVREDDDFSDQAYREYLQPEDDEQDPDQEQGAVAQRNAHCQPTDHQIQRDAHAGGQDGAPGKSEKA